MMEREGWLKRFHVIILFFLTSVVFLISGIFYYRRAFPEASINFKISKIEAIQKAKEFLKGRGIDPSPYYEVIYFHYDEAAKTFLDREIGIERMSELLSNEVQLWKWKIRWFQPHEKKEYQVFLSPEGRMVGYTRILPEEEHARSLTQEEALKKAKSFLIEIAKVPLSHYQLIEKDVTKRRYRTDFIFTWKKKDFHVSDGEYRISVTLQGDEIGSYQSFIKIPEDWRREYHRMRSRNHLIQNLSFLLSIPLFLMIPVMLLLRIRRRDICWSIAIVLTLCIFIAHLLMGLNSIPLYLSHFETTQTMESFIGQIFLHILVQALLYAMVVFAIIGASEPLYREQNPHKLSLSKFLCIRFFKTEEFFSSAIMGYSLAFFHIGYVVLFYYFGKKMGVWSPIEVGYTDALSTFLPWIYPLTVSLTAAFTEEFIFRVFAISFLRRFLPTWMAVTIPAFLWGFLHSNYPQQPCFIRGIEVGIIGIIAGYIFLRWGLLAVLIWHYTIDAIFISLFLFHSTNLYFIVSAIVVMGLLFIPMVMALIGLVKDHHFEKIAGLRNYDETQALLLKKRGLKISPSLSKWHPLKTEFIPLSRNKLMILAFVLILSTSFLIVVKVPKPWPSIQLGIDTKRAFSLAMDHLKRKGVDVHSYWHIVTFANETGQYDDRYIQNVSGWKGLREAYRLFKATGHWKVRFFRPLNEEEYLAVIDEKGEDIWFSHHLAEKSEGPTLAKDEAQALVEQYLRQRRKIPLDEYVLVDSYEDKKPARMDYHYVWKWEKAKPGEGEYRITASIAGHEVSHFSKFIKIPDKWRREDQEEGIFRLLFSFLKILCLSMGAGLALAIVAKDFINRKIEWTYVLIPPSIATIGYIFLEVNRGPIYLSDYQTSLSLSNFLLTKIISQVLYAGGLFLSILILSSAVLSLYREVYGGAPLWPRKKSYRRKALLASMIVGFSSILLFMSFMRFFKWINWTFDIPRTRISPEPLYGIDSFLPFIEISMRSLIFALIATLIILFGFLLYQRYLRRISYLLGVALILEIIFLADSTKHMDEFALLLVSFFIALTAGFFFFKVFIKENFLSCFIILLYMKGISQSLFFLNQSHPFYQMNGILALLTISLILFAVIILCYKNSKMANEEIDRKIQK